MKRLLLSVILFLSSCGFVTPPPNAVNVGGIPITYKLKVLNKYAGYANFKVSYCQITLDPTDLTSERNATVIIAHEYAHCVDLFKLKFSHNGFRNEGAIYGNYFARAQEGYAETYARMYIQKCGYTTSWFSPPEQFNFGPACDGPDPRTVTPDKVTGGLDALSTYGPSPVPQIR